MVAIVEKVKKEADLPYGQVCEELALPYSSLMRWKQRIRKGEETVKQPGPAKVKPLNVGALQEDIQRMRHGRHRSQGTGGLYKRYRDEISRRALQARVEAARREINDRNRAQERRVEWLMPGAVWSVDDTGGKRDRLEGVSAHVVHDLASRYKLKILGDDAMASGLRVALNLEELFLGYGAPLFMKRDNGSNLNHACVNEVLNHHGVIPLNSPPHYAPYNGGIERAQKEVQRQLLNRVGREKLSGRIFRLECEVVGHELNHQSRQSLKGQTACACLTANRGWMRLFGRRQRQEVYAQIQEMTVDIVEQMDQHSGAATEIAFRYAAETWMQLNQFIRVSQNGVVLPCSYQF